MLASQLLKYLAEHPFAIVTTDVTADDSGEYLCSLFFSEKANRYVVTDHITDMPVAERNREVSMKCRDYNDKYSVDDFKLII